MMVGEWKNTTIGEVVEFFDSRRIPLNSRQRAGRQGPYPYYGASGIFDYIDDYIFEGRYLLVAEDGENLNSRKLPIAFFANGRFWVNNHAHIIRGLLGVADDQFLKHWFAGASISGYVTGAAQPKLSQASLKRMEIKLPPYDEQRRIASILSAYDDLIENNTRRIAILEEMARRLYDEWFVQFRFPGHEGVPMVDSEIGKVPEGWEVAPISSIAKLKSGYAFKSKTFTADGAYKLVTIKNVHDARFVGHCESRLNDVPDNMPTHCRLKTGDILLSLTGNVGRVCVVHGESYLLNQRVAMIAPVDPSFRAYTYVMFRDETFRQRLENLATGAAQQNLSPVKTEQLPALLPPEDVLSRFSEVANPALEACSVLERKNTNLRTQRDLLLPKLISGEIDVSEVGEPAEEVAA